MSSRKRAWNDTLVLFSWNCLCVKLIFALYTLEAFVVINALLLLDFDTKNSCVFAIQNVANVIFSQSVFDSIGLASGGTSVLHVKLLYQQSMKVCRVSHREHQK